MPQDKQLNFIAFNIFAFFLAIYLVTASGTTFSDVGQLRLETVKSLTERFDLSVRSDMGMKGADGRNYSWFGIGSVLPAVPLYVAGKWAGIPPENAVSVMNQLVAAATAVLVFLFPLSLGYSKRASLTASILYGLGTMAWPYAKDSCDHTIETFLVALSLYFASRHAEEQRKPHLLFSAFAFGFALITRTSSVMAIPPLLVLLVFPNLRKRGLKGSLVPALNDFALFLVALVPFASLNLWYNHYRFGSILESGYGLMAARAGIDYFSGTVATALLGFATSPGKGFFFYSPAAVLVFFSIRPFARKHPGPAISFMLLAMIYLLFYSRYIYWHGDNAWGPRYLFVITPFLIIPSAALFDSPAFRERRVPRLLTLAVFIAGVTVQLAAVSINPLKYFVHLQEVEKIAFITTAVNEGTPIIIPPPDTYFSLKRSPLLAQARFIRDAMQNIGEHGDAGDPVTASRMLKAQPWMNVPDFWWMYKFHVEGSLAGFAAAAVLLLPAGLSLRRLLRATRQVGLESAHHG